MTENKGGWVEAGILPTELLPLKSRRNLNKKRQLSTTPKPASVRIPDSTTAGCTIHSKDEVQGICAAWFEKRTPADFDDSLWSRFAIDRLVPKQAPSANTLILQRIFSHKSVFWGTQNTPVGWAVWVGRLSSLDLLVSGQKSQQAWDREPVVGGWMPFHGVFTPVLAKALEVVRAGRLHLDSVWTACNATSNRCGSRLRHGDAQS
jgi:hypothetical protein